ncbi:MAG TPA: hypothetical protein VKD91_14765 [Pyrinomonadaceae bacterium]|nr:hypothetical protein [Pyrinomonadaceae bacterium]
MAVFNPGDKQETQEPKIEVTVTAANPIKVGTHRFQLIVVDDDDNESLPMIAEILVRDLELPTAVLEIQPKSVEFGKSFTLVGVNSSDVPPGSIKKFIWQRLD